MALLGRVYHWGLGKIHEVLAFFTTGLWQIRTKDVSWGFRIGVRLLRAITVAIRGFNTNRNFLQASALTFYTLLTIVPVLAILFGLAQMFGIDELVQQELALQFEAHEEVYNSAQDFALQLLSHTHGSVILGSAGVFLLWVVMGTLTSIEAAFNMIWQVRRGRSLWRKATDFTTILLLLPFAIAFMSGFVVFIIQAIFFFLRGNIVLMVMPYVLTCVTFTLLYKVLPNRKIRWIDAMVGGICAGFAYQLFQWACIKFHMNISTYSLIYGGFAAVPLFLIWLQYSWLIILSGAEAAHGYGYAKALERT